MSLACDGKAVSRVVIALLPHAHRSVNLIIGIDLGTTNSACSIMRDGVPIMVPNSLGQNLTPSAVSIDDNGQIIIGMAARERQSTHANQTATAFKRYMGTDREIALGKKRFRAEELSSFVLKALKADAEAFLGEPVTEAVITVPAYFNNKQRTATRHAGELAGLKVERLINEPTAAALAHGFDQRDIETKFLVFDLGGGTFDVSILEIFEGLIEVRSSAGDNRLGGEDFNAVLIENAQTRFSKEIGSDLKNNNDLFQKLREAAERTRRLLSTETDAKFAFVWKDQHYEFSVTQDEFERDCASLIARLREPVLRSIKDSTLDVSELDEIILVGGGTRMPIVRRSVTKMFGRFPRTDVDPDEAVAKGAAVQAGLKARDASLSEVVLTDVSPFSLGVEISERQSESRHVDGLFLPIIERNCVIPASREHELTAMQMNQPFVELKVYQGESRWVRDNILLGKLKVDLPRIRNQYATINCRFTYDINGMLEVDVLVPESGLRLELVIVDKDGISEDELKRRRKDLEKLKIHPRDTDAMRAILGRAGRCYENAIGGEREWIGTQIGRFEAILAGQDPRACEGAAKELDEILDSLEGPTLL
jgi:molecular chaperone HscC